MMRTKLASIFQRITPGIAKGPFPMSILSKTLPLYSSFDPYGGERDYTQRRGAPSNNRDRFNSFRNPDMGRLSFKKTIQIDPECQTPIDEMELSAPTVQALKEKGFDKMTPIQSQCFELVRKGEDVVARSRTGTGKTLAFGVPIIERLKDFKRRPNRNTSPLVLVLEPTRELAVQVADELRSVAKYHGLNVVSLFGGASFMGQTQQLQRGVDIIVATPGRLIDHLEQGTVDFDATKGFVLDEGDLMLEMGFQDDVERILSYGKNANPEPDSPTANKSQVLLFSATMPSWICKLTDRLMDAPVFYDAVQEGETRLAETISHYSVRLPSNVPRLTAAMAQLEDIIVTKGGGGQTIIFCNTKDDVNQVGTSDIFGHLTARVLHGDISQATRTSTLRSFREKKIDILVATDVAARGLDISGVELVVHLAPPKDTDSYVHRAGRTGRAGRAGTSILFYDQSEEYMVKNLQRSLTFKFSPLSVPSPAQVCESSAQIAIKKLDAVEDSTIEFFWPHAEKVFGDLKAGKYFQKKEQDGEVEKVNVSDEVLFKTFIARCLAAASNRDTIVAKSLLTGRNEHITLKFLPKKVNPKIPATTAIQTFLKEELKMEVFNNPRANAMKVIPTEDDEGKSMLVADFEQEVALEILKKLKTLEAGVASFEVTFLEQLPEALAETIDANSFSRNEDFGGNNRRATSSNYRGGGDRSGYRNDRSGNYNDRSSGGYRSGGGDRYGGGGDRYGGGNSRDRAVGGYRGGYSADRSRNEMPPRSARPARVPAPIEEDDDFAARFNKYYSQAKRN